LVDAVISHPIASITTVVVVLGGLQAASDGFTFVAKTAEQIAPATHEWVRVAMEPLSHSIDRFLLFQQQQALEKALKDPAIATSPNAKERVEQLQLNIEDTKQRVCRENPKLLECRHGK